MDIKTIKELWKTGPVNVEAGIGLWNNMAQMFAKHDLPTSKDSLSMKIIEEEKIVYSGCKVLDVGCGAGKFSFALENQGAEVTATDFSEEMIKTAKELARQKKSKVEFSVDNWHTLDIKEKGWGEKFDLVLANMTPAVASADTFLKLIESSRGWVIVTKPTRRKNTILDALSDLLGMPKERTKMDDRIAYAFDLAWYMGACPKFKYQEEVWEGEQSLEEAIEEYTLRMESARTLSQEEKEKIRTYLEEKAVDGQVPVKTTMTVVSMYWKVA